MYLQNKWFFFFLALLLTPLAPSLAKNQMLILGGGGEGQKDKTIFDGSIKDYGKITNHSGWNISMAFNGGHKKTERLLDKYIPKKVNRYPDFTRKSYDKIIQETIDKIKKNEIKSGETLFMLIDSHGGESDSTKASHGVSLTSKEELTNYVNLEESSSVNLDSLKELLLLSKEKGIMVGLTDLSCYGGNTLKLKDEFNLDNICIISATGPNLMSDATGKGFGNKFLKELGEGGGSLEEIFLKTRSKSLIEDFPMISTDEGVVTQDKILYYLEKFLSFDREVSMVTPVTNEVVNRSRYRDYYCQVENDFSMLISQVEDVKKVLSYQSRKKTKEMNKLIGALLEYKEIQDGMYELYKSLDVSKLNEQVNYTRPGSTSSLVMRRQQLYEMYLEETIKILEKKKNLTQEEMRNLDYTIGLRNFRDKLRSEDKNYDLYLKIKKEFKKLERKQFSFARKIGRYEKELYNYEYEKKLNEMKKSGQINENDPCRRIKF